MIRSLTYFFIAILFSCSQREKVSPVWIKLFNGHDLEGWTPKIKDYPVNENFDSTFRVTDGKLRVAYDHYGSFNNRFGHLFYKDKFSYYLISVEYRFINQQAKDGPGWAFRNSGIMVHCQSPESMPAKQDFPISIEVQLLGGNGTAERPTANVCTPGTNIVYDGKLLTDHCINSTSPTFHGDQWVSVDVLVLGDSLIKHIVNRDTVLTYSKPQVGGGVVNDFDPKMKIDGTPLKEGYISLQSESHPVEFRKVELVDLSPYAHDPKLLGSVLKELRNRVGAQN